MHIETLKKIIENHNNGIIYVKLDNDSNRYRYCDVDDIYINQVGDLVIKVNPESRGGTPWTI